MAYRRRLYLCFFVDHKNRTVFVEQCITILLQQLYKIVIAVFLSNGIILAVIACGIRLQNHIFCVQNMFFCGITDIVEHFSLRQVRRIEGRR